jgi:protease IV
VKRVLVLILASIGGVVLFLFVFFLALSWALLSPTPLPDRMVMEVDLNQGLVETVPDDPIYLALERHRIRTREVVEALHRAANDDRVVEVLFRGSAGLPGMGTAEELREAILHFRESGKPARYFAETFGEFGPGHAGYYLATAFDQVLLQPSGEVGITGLGVEGPFLAEALEKLDVEPIFDQRWEYKSAGEIFTERGFSEPAREALRTSLEAIHASLVAGVAQGRGLEEARVRELLGQGPFPALEAREAGLVDDLIYLDDIRDRLEEEHGDDVGRVGVRSYLTRSGGAWGRGARVALVYGVGPVLRGQGGYDPLTGSLTMSSDRVAAAIRDATDDERVRAIVFRVDSPGGSWVASDQIRRALERARERGKPVVVSMGDVAASGGYLVAVDADRILAHPSTLTGSIGVIAGRFATRDFWERFGITWDRVEVGEGADYYSGLDGFTPEGWQRFQLFLDRIYDDFVDRVAQGRGLDHDRVHEVARGRVWTGQQALELELIDGLGGYTAALAAARELADLEPDAPVQVAVYPAERTLFQVLMEEGRGVSVRGDAPSGLAAVAQAGEALRALAWTLRTVGVPGAPGGLRLGPGRPGWSYGPVQAPPLEFLVR